MKYYIDYEINLIQNYFLDEIFELYEMIDVNVYQENIFYIKMLLKDFNFDNYLFGLGVDELSVKEQEVISYKLCCEMFEIFYGCNMFS